MSGAHFSRQGFLGPNADAAIRSARIAVVGTGGGGSHVVQQLAHVGFQRFALFDPDRVETSNLNRNVGSTLADVEQRMLKVDIAQRLIRSLCPDADVEALAASWQEHPEHLRACDVVVGCVDSFAARRELEISCRRHLQPYVDIGLDVHSVPGEPPQMGGQVIVSMPGHPCMECLGFLTEERLGEEASRYGAAGIRPQVVWANGLLASAAVGFIVDLVTGWSGAMTLPVFLSYDANRSTLTPHPRLRARKVGCPHFPREVVGAPVFMAI